MPNAPRAADQKADAGAVVTAVTARVHEQLVPDGWWIEVCADALPVFSVSVEHPLSPPFVLRLDASSADVFQTLEDFLVRPEFVVIGSRPQRLPHAALIRTIRENAFGSGWPVGVTEELARILHGHELLTDAEAEWLIEAGAAWTHLPSAPPEPDRHHSQQRSARLPTLKPGRRRGGRVHA